jgi:hypothetical protein
VVPLPVPAGDTLSTPAFTPDRLTPSVLINLIRDRSILAKSLRYGVCFVPTLAHAAYQPWRKAPYKPRHNFLSAGGELTRPYLVDISLTSPQGRTAVRERSRCIRVKVFKSNGLH